MSKVIFLDVDGVLNGDYMYALGKKSPRCCGYLGIGKIHLQYLYDIVQSTNAKIVLISSWKYDYNEYLHNHTNSIGKYLREKLRKYWKMVIYDTTIIYDKSYGRNRGYEIKSWLASKTDIDAWVVLDDEIFEDYDDEIMKHLVKTDSIDGLTSSDASKAIEILGCKINKCYDDFNE